MIYVGTVWLRLMLRAMYFLNIFIVEDKGTYASGGLRCLCILENRIILLTLDTYLLAGAFVF